MALIEKVPDVVPAIRGSRLGENSFPAARPRASRKQFLALGDRRVKPSCPCMYRSDLTIPKLECPYCGRSLKPPSEARIVTCDGCEQQFEPGKVRTKPPSVGRAAIGWVLFVFGIVLLVPAVTAATQSNFHERDLPMRLLGIFLIPAVLTFTGLALKRGSAAVHGASVEAAK